jgi:hypothetical protein
MKARDRQIIKSLEMFRCMSREDIEEFHFFEMKNRKTSANTVLQRLVAQGHIEVNRTYKPYVYFPSPSSIKKTSQKIRHYLGITEACREILRRTPVQFEVEPKLGPKGTVEPDAMFRMNGRHYFLELQRSVYNKRQMNEKIERYETYFSSGAWKDYFDSFPEIIMVTRSRYEIKSHVVTIVQVRNISDYLDRPLEKQP